MATIKTLLNKSVEELEAMSQQQLEEYFGPFAKVAPIQAKEEETQELNLEDVEDDKPKRKSRTKAPSGDELTRLALELAKKHGVDVSQMNLPAGLKK